MTESNATMIQPLVYVIYITKELDNGDKVWFSIDNKGDFAYGDNKSLEEVVQTLAIEYKDDWLIGMIRFIAKTNGIELKEK